MKTRVVLGSLAACAACATLLLAGCGGRGNDDVAETFRNPPELASANGALRVTLQVSTGNVMVAGQTVRTTVYNGSYVPPTLRIKPGESLYLELDNRSEETTNEHYHGLNVATGINGDATIADNIFVAVDPGAKASYRIDIPGTHAPGLYWYHAHHHGRAQRQVMGGLSGGLVIDGLLDPLPELAGIAERVMLLKDIQITPQGTLPDDISASDPSIRMVNGQVDPTLVMRPGETQLLRIANIGSDLYYRLKLDGHTLFELARDGNRRNQLVAADELLLAPGSRSEVLVQGGAPGRYALRALDFDTGPVGDRYPETTLATFVVQGSAMAPIVLANLRLPAVEDLRNVAVARKRTIVFDEDPVNNLFFIDSGNGAQVFDPNRIDSTIEAGTVEEWTVLNATQELHVFHIHQTDFQVLEVDRVAQPFTGRQDNVNVPLQRDAAGSPGQVKLLIDFRNPRTIGRFVYHCHILEHEDGGMMAVAEVVAPGAMPASLARAQPLKVGALARTSTRQGGAAGETARIEQTLDAVQAGSYCRSRTPVPALRVSAPS
jgi:suppressor of ftsI